ncbi:MAG: RNA polymerase sigma factor [Chloroflexia bacterium]|nr:RNA polymerase sigma factor [Chloroflexia bacterium]
MFKSKKIKVTQKTDEQLISYISNGCSDSFNELYRRYHKRLLYYFYRMLWNDKDLAQDFLQEIFYKIIDKPHLINPERKFSTWIFSVAYNMCKNEYRSKEVRKIIVFSENPDNFSEHKNEKTNHEQLVSEVFKELESFDESHKTAFLMKYREGFNIDEISEILELPKGTVKSRLFYTRKKLQEILSEKIC